MPQKSVSTFPLVEIGIQPIVGMGFVRTKFSISTKRILRIYKIRKIKEKLEFN